MYNLNYSEFYDLVKVSLRSALPHRAKDRTQLLVDNERYIIDAHANQVSVHEIVVNLVNQLEH